MTARDDYRAVASMLGTPHGAVWREAERMCDEIDRLRLALAWQENISQGRGEENERLRRWQAEAMTVLSEWEAVWEAAGSPGPLGGSKAAAVSVLIEQLWLENTKLGREIDRP